MPDIQQIISVTYIQVRARVALYRRDLYNKIIVFEGDRDDAERITCQIATTLSLLDHAMPKLPHYEGQPNVSLYQIVKIAFP